MVGDTLKKAGAGEQGLVTIKDLGDTEYGTSNVVMFHSFIHKTQFEILGSHTAVSPSVSVLYKFVSDRRCFCYLFVCCLYYFNLELLWSKVLLMP